MWTKKRTKTRARGSSKSSSTALRDRRLSERVISEVDEQPDEDVSMDVDEPKKPAKPSNGDDDLAEYNLDDYDEDDAMPGMRTLSLYLSVLDINYYIVAMGPFSNIKGLTYYRNNDEDPYITLKEVC